MKNEPIIIRLDVTINVPNNPAIPTTTNMLKMLEPKMFPTAISGLPFLAAETDTASSGRLVPNARIVAAITSLPRLTSDDSWTIESIVYFALMKINIVVINKTR